MKTVEEAEAIIQAKIKNFGAETMDFKSALRRVLAEDLQADRDLPPFNRVTMDGIAICFEAFKKGTRTFKIKATQAAGEAPINIDEEEECVEIMTGAALPETTDTVIRYEDIDIIDGKAVVKEVSVKKGQNLHLKGKDKKQAALVATAHQLITPTLISMAASIGKTEISVKKLPSIVVISSGDELVDVDKTPSLYQIRRSNSYTVQAVLQQYALHADLLHIPDNPEIIRQQIDHCLKNYDVILLSGGVSMGKFDYIPQALQALSVHTLFHKVQQKPGKPFWFGSHSKGTLVFAFPGNPVSTFLCLYRYFLPWLEASLQLRSKQPLYAILHENFTCTTPLQYFLQVKLQMNEKGQLLATPFEGNGSGDFANLILANAFLELPLERDNFMKGEVYKVWLFNPF